MSGAYSDQELLLLSNFVYIPVCTSSAPLEEIIGQYRDGSGGFSADSVAAAAAGGGMSREDVAIVFTQMDKRIRENPDFGKLSASRTLEERNVRAVCYTGPKDNDPVVAFRGTGGTVEAWSDNFEGAFCEQTDIQRVADDFLKHECGIYDDIVVTGHSKGGNLAQYVTVMQQERVGSCLSFDGQGFSDELIGENAEAVRTASPKIRSVSAYNDFVNILLTSIAGTCIYVANDSSAAAAHSPVTLLTENEFDDEGNFISIKEQSLLTKGLSVLTERAVGALSTKRADEQEAFSHIMGSAIALALCTPPDKLSEGVIAPTLGHMGAQFARDIMVSKLFAVFDEPLISNNVYMNVAACKKASLQIKDQSVSINRIVSSVNVIRGDLAYSIASKICAERALLKVCDDLTGISRALERTSDAVMSAVVKYTECEKSAALLMK